MEIRKTKERFQQNGIRFFSGDIIIITDGELLLLDNGLDIASSFMCDKFNIKERNIDIDEIRKATIAVSLV